MCHLSNNGPAAAPGRHQLWHQPQITGEPPVRVGALFVLLCWVRHVSSNSSVKWRGVLCGLMDRVHTVGFGFGFGIGFRFESYTYLLWGRSGIGIGFDLLHRLVVFWCCHLSFDLLLIACCLSPRLTSKVYLSLVRGFVVVIAIVVVVVAVAAFVV